jgi:hypothetical protein
MWRRVVLPSLLRHNYTRKMVRAASPETSVISYQSTRHHIRDGSVFVSERAAPFLFLLYTEILIMMERTTMTERKIWWLNNDYGTPCVYLSDLLSCVHHTFCNLCLCTSQVWFKLVPDECNRNTDTWPQELRVPVEIRRMEYVYLFSSFGLVCWGPRIAACRP